MTDVCLRKFVTVIYEIVDDKEWGLKNPLKYQHNGLKATRVSIGDLAHQCELLEEICKENICLELLEI